MNELTEKPFAPACERNQQAILAEIKSHLRPSDQLLLEIGSGTGQHAVYMAKRLPDVFWQTSDVVENHSGIDMWLEEAALRNLGPPLAFEVGRDEWPKIDADVVFTSNTLHIMSAALMEILLKQIGQHLKSGGRLMVYGPFKYQGDFTTKSNAEFDLWLKDIDPKRGIRDIEHICKILKVYNIKLVDDVDMPANNQFLVFEKHD